MARSLPPPPGYYVPAVLFFDENENLDEISIQAHVLRLAQGGVTGILVQGSNGEAQHLSNDERKQAIALTRKTLDDNNFNNVLVIAGTGAQSTRETKKLCVDAKEAGASYVLVLTPSTWPPQMTTENIVRFHREVENLHSFGMLLLIKETFVQVADASPIPVMIYNFAVVTAGIDLDSGTISTLAEHPNIVGTKLSCGNIGKLHRLTTRFPSTQFAVFAGRTDTFLHGLNAGSAGAIAALVNILPKLHGRLYKLFQEGNLAEAMVLQGKLGHGDWAISKVGGIGGVKAVVSKHFGYGATFVRGPLKTVDPQLLDGNKYYQVLADLIDMEKKL